MAVVYIKKLEEQPASYDSKFSALTKGVNHKVKDWILGRIQNNNIILDIGCGTGTLAKKLALKGNNVKALDNNLNMIKFAIDNYPTEKKVDLLYQIGSYRNLGVANDSQDLIISTFMLSELKPFEQQIFLRNVWKALKTDGRLIVAAEFIPSGFWRQNFKVKRWWFKRKVRKLRLEETYLNKNFHEFLSPIGFKIHSEKQWNHGMIRAIELQKVQFTNINKPGYYQPKTRNFKGIKSQFRIYRCLFTGQIDSVPIEPGIYRSGNPDNNSPIIVTSNYEYTYIKVMRDLNGINAWVLCVDSNGINVWCAARGNDFGNNQLLDAIEATGLEHLVDSKTLILPQLSAGGVSIPQLPNKFPFKIRFGPVWSKDIKEFLENHPKKKPDSMKLAKFTLKHRLRAGVTHTTFLYRKIFILPLIGLVFLLLALNQVNKLIWVGELALWIILTNAIISIFFPLSKFTRKFVLKALFYGILNLAIISLITWFIHNSVIYTLLHCAIVFWLGFFSTMSFSGYTMATSPREIQGEYPTFRRINIILMIITFISLGLTIIYFLYFF